MKIKNRKTVFKYIVLLLLWQTAVFGVSQDKFFTRSGYIKFYSSTPIEDILAENHKVTSVFDMATGNIEFAVLIKAFEFEKALMEEHFNENYMESDRYPKATFKGRISGLTTGESGEPKKQKVTATGDLTIHGVTRHVSVPGSVTTGTDQLLLESEFKIAPADYDIRIPNTVKEKIAKELTVTLNMPLTKL